jgi:Fuc2NAc and GlcNAc transferase
VLFLLSTVLVRVFCALACRYGLLDLPNARSMHREKVPRGGGVIFVLLWLLGLIFSYRYQWISTRELFVFLPGITLISLLGFWDDCRSLPASVRFYIQVGIAALTLFGMGDLSSFHIQHSAFYLGYAGYVLGLLGLVWSTNVFNFMDGLDGFSACEALFVLGVGGLLFWWQGHPEMARLAWMMAICVLGFLIWNWPKAKVFMGDAGSYCLGFSIALFALIGDSWYHIPISLWVILYSLFWFDATVTLIRRLSRKENIATPHLNHAFHRLHRAGYTTIQILTGAILINAVLAGMTIVLYFNRTWIVSGMVCTIVLLSILYIAIEKIYPMEKPEAVNGKKHD